MRVITIKYLTIIALLAFEAWFLWPSSESWVFEWEPLVGMILTFTAYLGLEVKDHQQPQPKAAAPAKVVTESDRSLFAEFSKLFTPSLISFYRDHDFHGTFSADPMKKLFHYVDHWTTAEHEFIDTELEREHQLFHQKARALASALVEYTRPQGAKFATVKPVDHDGGPLPPWVKKGRITGSSGYQG